MVDLKTLQTLAATIRQLSPEERQQLDRLVEDYSETETAVVPPQIDEDIQTRIRILNEAFAEIREGLNEEELAEMVEAMNTEFVKPDDYGWLEGENKGQAG